MTRRLIVGVVAVAVIPLGLFVRFLPWGIFADLAGGVLYAILIYLLAAFVAPRSNGCALAVFAGTWCFAVEFLQLSDLPKAAAQAFPPARLVFGTGFAASDLLAYTFGILLIFAVDRALLLRAVSRIKATEGS